MRNQLVAAERIGLRAVTINSTNQKEWPLITEQLLADKIDILLISPERLANEDFRTKVLLPLAARIGFFVVDEAHCISDWGHDFRPDYRRITRILQALPLTVPVLGTTATANNRVIDDVVAQLGPNLLVLRGALTRQSLRLQNISFPSQIARLAWLADQLPKLMGSGIIYTLTVQDAELVARWLRTQGIKAVAYSSKTQEREILEEQLLNNKVKALVATSALGMGFDKPDLGFVIHYQRPGSVVHYYQQVGRAGRAVDLAYGILLSGAEDQDITDYFIESAFPPEIHVQQILEALNQADDGLSTQQLEGHLNLSWGQIDKVLKLLSMKFPAPVTKNGSRWYATPVNYIPEREKIVRITQIRRHEQARMLDYMQSQECLMMFLARELDDPQSTPCGKCAVCLKSSLLPENYSQQRSHQAMLFLRCSDQLIEPRKQWRSDALSAHGWRGNIGLDREAEVGRALSVWGDAGWGALVKQGKYQDNYLSDELVEGAVEMVSRWQPHPFPTWVVCVPSLTRPDLVPNFAQRFAHRLGLSFVAGIEKTRQTRPQKEMLNSYQQAHNLEKVFTIKALKGIAGPVFLLDDMVDSGWTFTVVTALLRQAGSGPVFPLALALSATGQAD